MRKKLILAAVVAMCAASVAQAKVYRAGLKGGYITTYDGGKYHTVEIPDIGVFSNVLATTVAESPTDSKPYPSTIWGQNRTWGYHGQMYFDGVSTYYFAELVDDALYFKVGDKQALKDEGWEDFTVSDAVKPEAGWYDVLLRIGNGTGGAGAKDVNVKDKNGDVCGFGFVKGENLEKPGNDMTSFVRPVDPGDGSLFRCVEEETNCIRVDGYKTVADGYELTVTSLAPGAVKLTVYYGAMAGDPESATGWTATTPLNFAPNATRTVKLAGSFTQMPVCQLYLEGVGTTLAEGIGAKFWQWEAVSDWAAVPTVKAVLASVSSSTATFAVTLGCEKENFSDAAPEIELKAFYDAADGGQVEAGWTECKSYGSNNGKGDVSCVLTDLEEGGSYCVRFAARIGSANWVWSDCLTFSTGAFYLDAVPAAVAENDPTGSSFSIRRPEKAATEAQSVYLSYQGTEGNIAGLVDHVDFPAGTSVVTVPFTMIDNGTEDGDRNFVVSLVANDAYLLGTPATATIAVLDDESATVKELIWVGDGNDLKWGTAVNWSPARVPTAMDAAVFTDTAPADGATVEVDDPAVCRTLKFSRANALTLGGAGLLKAGGIVCATDAESGKDQTISVPLTLHSADPQASYNGEKGWCVLNVSGAGALKFNSPLSGSVKLWKIGSGVIDFCRENNIWNGRLRVFEGSGKATAYHSFGGTDDVNLYGMVEVGGGTTPAYFEFFDRAPYETRCTAHANGRIKIGECQKNEVCRLYAYDGGEIDASSIHWHEVVLTGGNVTGGTWNLQKNWESISTRASRIMSVFSANAQLDGGETARLLVDDGPAPVDLLIDGGFWGGKSSKALSKRNPGVVRSTKDCAFENYTEVGAGAWYVDNPKEYGLGHNKTSVSDGAKLGGTGFIGRKTAGELVVLLNGTETKYATLSPGTIDDATGAHIYGTLTLGREDADALNPVKFGTFAHLEIGFGARENSVLPHDKLVIHGKLEIGENCVLDLKTNSADPKLMTGGACTIIAADAITGKFAKVLRPEGAKWRVRYNATVPAEGEEPVVTSVSVSLSSGFSLFVR